MIAENIIYPLQIPTIMCIGCGYIWLPMRKMGPKLSSVGGSLLQKFAPETGEVAEIEI